MADINASLPIESIAEGNSVKISKDLNDNAVGNAMFMQISDQTNDLDLTPIDSAYGATPTALPISGKYEATPTTYADGDAVPFLMTTNGKLQVEATLTGAGGGTSSVDDTAFTIATDSLTPIGGIYQSALDSVDDGDTGVVQMTINRILLNQPSDGTNDMPMMDANTRAGYQIITDGTNEWSIDGSGFGQIDIAAQSLTALKISKDANANAETNPIYVQTVDGTLSGIEIIDYDTAAAVASGGTSNHDYTVTAASTLKVRKCLGAASGSQKIEIQSGPIAGLLSQGVQFTSQANQNWVIEFDGLLEVPDTSTGTLRIIRTNRENGPSQDVYSTIIGTEV